MHSVALTSSRQEAVVSQIEAYRTQPRAADTVAVAGSGQIGKIRLTPLGRCVFGALGALVLLGVISVMAMLAAPQAQAQVVPGSGTAEFDYIVVPEGGSLWQLATELAPASDPRDVIADLVKLNQLGSLEVQSGDLLAIPMEYQGAAIVS